MAKGKKSSGNKYTSKNERPNVNKKILNMTRNYYLTMPFDRLVNQVNAWEAGKKVMVTIANPNDKDTKHRFIRVHAKEMWGDYKARYTMKPNTTNQND
jgi:hypothetical protein